MTLATPVAQSVAPHVYQEQELSFPYITALPMRDVLEQGTLYTFFFANGYGAHVLHSGEQFEYCVLDCATEELFPNFSTPIASELLTTLNYDQVCELLYQTERLDLHPTLHNKGEWLAHAEF